MSSFLPVIGSVLSLWMGLWAPYISLHLDMSVPFVSNSTIKGSTCSICNHTMLSLYYILYRPTIDQSLSFHRCHKYIYYVILLILYIYIRYDDSIVCSIGYSHATQMPRPGLDHRSEPEPVCKDRIVKIGILGSWMCIKMTRIK